MSILWLLQIEAKRLWKLNEALSLGILAPLGALYAPLAPPHTLRALPHLQWQPQRPFHTSALCASVLDSITLPYRLDQQSPNSPLGAARGEKLMQHATMILLSTFRHNDRPQFLPFVLHYCSAKAYCWVLNPITACGFLLC